MFTNRERKLLDTLYKKYDIKKFSKEQRETLEGLDAKFTIPLVQAVFDKRATLASFQRLVEHDAQRGSVENRSHKIIIPAKYRNNHQLLFKSSQYGSVAVFMAAVDTFTKTFISPYVLVCLAVVYGRMDILTHVMETTPPPKACLMVEHVKPIVEFFERLCLQMKSQGMVFRVPMFHQSSYECCEYFFKQGYPGLWVQCFIAVAYGHLSCYYQCSEDNGSPWNQAQCLDKVQQEFVERFNYLSFDYPCLYC